MLKLKIGRNNAEFYSGELKELVFARYLDHQRFAMMDARIGGTVQDFDRHLETLNRYYKQGDQKKIDTYINSLRTNVHFVLSGTNPALMSFVALLHSWNGRPVRMRTDEGIQEWSERIKKHLKVGVFQSSLNSIKKKSSLKLKTIFRSYQMIRKYFTTTRSLRN